MISVIIPCFNSEEYVARAIDSVLKQTYKDYEIILVDNNSSDNTISVLRHYSERFPEFIKVFNECKKGAPAARNKGLYEAKGEWIEFLDADDELLPSKLETQISLASKSEADIIVGSCYISKTIKNQSFRKIRKIETNNVWKGLITSRLGITSANLWRRQAVLKLGGWNENKSSSQEYELLFKILKNNEKVTFCSSPLTVIHVRENSIHKSREDSRFIEILNNNVQLRLDIKTYLKSKGLLTKELTYITDTYIYSYLINTTGIYPFSLKRGNVADYVKRILKEMDLQLPIQFILNFYFRHFKYKMKTKL